MPRQVTKRAVRASLVLSTLVLGASLYGCGKTETSATLMADAMQYQQKGDTKAALIQMKNAVAKSPDDAEVRFQLATLYNQAGDPVSAEKEARRAASLGFDRARVTPELTRALLMQGQPQKALDESAASAAGNAELLATRGDAYLALKDVAKAREAYEQALAAKPGTAGALIGMARLAMAAGDHAGANARMEQAIAANPKSPAVWYLKGSLLNAQGKPDEAIAAYGSVLSIKPDHVAALTDRAHLHLAAERIDAAKADIAAARKAAPGALSVIYSQALLDFRQNQFKAAQESLQKILRVAPDHMLALLLSAAVEMNLGALEQAEQHVKKYLESNPGDAYASKLRAQILMKNSRPKDAAVALEPLAKYSKDPQLLALAGQSALQNKDYETAGAYFAKASALAPKVASLHTSLGLSKLGQGDSAAAISDLQAATTLDPKSSEAGIALIQAEIGLKRYDKALAAAAELEKNQPDNGQVHNIKGGIYLAQGDAPKARASFEKAVTLQPKSFAPVINLAQLDMRDKNPEAARQRLEAFLQRDSKNASAMGALADIALAQGEPAKATQWLEKANAENPGMVGPAVQLGKHYLRINQAAKALTLARTQQSVNPNNPELLDLLGLAQLANKDQAAALETYSKLAKALPKSAEAQVRLARVQMLVKNDAGAQADLKRAVALAPDYAPARLAQVELAMRAGKQDEALAIARELQKHNPKAPDGYALEADLLMSMKRPGPALAAYEKAFALAKTPQLLVRIASLLKQTGKGNEAETRLLAWRAANPGDPVVALYVAEHYLSAKQFKPAAETLRAVLKQNPGNPLALNNLAWAYQQDKDPRALETAELALKAAPNSPAVLDTVGWMLLEQGNTVRALPMLQKAVGLAPQSPELRYHLAVALHKSGDKLSARKEVEKLLADNKTFPQIDEARALLKLL